MTNLKLQTNPPEGSGFTHGLLDELYDKRQSRQHIEYVVVQGLLKISGHGENDTAKGTKRHVKGEFIRLEPVRDTSDAEDVAWQITRSFERRTTPGNPQGELPLSNSSAERKRSYLEQLDEWAKDHEKTTEELDEMFVDMLGGPEHAAATKVANATLVHLIEFVGWITADSAQSTVPTPAFSDLPPQDSDEDPDEDESGA